MGFRFRKQIQLAPGVKVNVNSTSLSVSAGVPGSRVTVNSNGSRTASVGVPGTGASYRATTQLGGRATSKAPSEKPAASAFAEALGRARTTPDALRPWFDEPDFAVAARMVYGFTVVHQGRNEEALEHFQWVLSRPVDEFAEQLLGDQGWLPTTIYGIEITLPGGRNTVAVLTCHLLQTSGREREGGRAMLKMIPDTDWAIAGMADAAHQLADYATALEVIGTLPQIPTTPFAAFALVIRAATMRAKGDPYSAIGVLTACQSVAHRGSTTIWRRWMSEAALAYQDAANSKAAHQWAQQLLREVPDSDVALGILKS